MHSDFSLKTETTKKRNNNKIHKKNIEEGHSTERVWCNASREPSDTLPRSQLCIQTRNVYHTPYSQGFSLLERHSRRRLVSPWVGLINADRKRLKLATYSHPRCDLNLLRLFRLSLLLLPLIGRIFFLLHPRGHKPTAPLVYCGVPYPRVK